MCIRSGESKGSQKGVGLEVVERAVYMLLARVYRARQVSVTTSGGDLHPRRAVDNSRIPNSEVVPDIGERFETVCIWKAPHRPCVRVLH